MPSPPVIARGCLLAVAVVVAAWYGLGQVQLHAQDQAQALIPTQTNISAVRLRHVLSLLDRAGTLNPDRSVDLLRSEAYTHAGDSRRALAVTERVVAAEPQNLSAWLLLEIAAFPTDRRLAAHAVVVQRQLDPPVPASP